jgi:TatA/E family protein of Tat protein translocase
MAGNRIGETLAPASFYMPGSGELIVIFILVLLLFGPDKLPELARNVAKGLREIRKVSDEFRAQLKLDDD